MRAPALVLGLAIVLSASPGFAEDEGADNAFALGVANPYSPLISQQYYAQLRKSPTRAFLYELALPGLGFAYARFKAQAIVSAASTLIGAGLWISGAVVDNDALRYTGVGVFAAARVYGVVVAPTSAAMLNAAFRRQLGIRLAYAF